MVAVIVKILSYKALEISPLLIQILKERLILLGDLIYQFWSCITHHIQIDYVRAILQRLQRMCNIVDCSQKVALLAIHKEEHY